MSVTETSLEAYKYALNTINRKQAEVFEVIVRHGPITNLGISEILGRPINCITGRTNELRAKGVVCEAGKTKQSSGCSAKLWQVVYPKELF